MVGVRDKRAHRPLVLLVAALAALLAGAPRAAAAQQMNGFDISHWNGAIDWIRVATGGYSFVFAKATEGKTLTDPTYSINRSGAGTFGLRLGAYHFARPGGSGQAGIAASAIAQADHFVDVAEPKPGDLPPALDLETTGGLSPANLARWTQYWLDEVQARTGVKALVYASPNFWKDALAGTTSFAVGGYPLWIAHWTKHAAPTVPAAGWAGHGWTFWQWTNCSTIPGFAHCADGDRYNGATLSPVAIQPQPAGAPVLTTQPTVLGQPAVGSPLAALPGVWSGARPLSFTYQWLSCDARGSGCAPIAGATSETYTPTFGDSGRELMVLLTARNASGSVASTSAPTLAVAATGAGGGAAPQVTTMPVVAGAPQVGQSLSVGVGTWTGSPTAFAYQWRRCDPSGACSDLSETAPVYVITPGDVGATIQLVVTARGPGGTASVTAAPVGPIVPAPLPPPAAGSAVSTEGAAGAVTTAGNAATVTWQPGSVPTGAKVSLVSRTPKLALPGTGATLGIAPLQVGLQWWVDVQWAAAPAGAIPGFAAGGVRGYEAVPTVTSPVLGTDQRFGAYRDSSGVLHVLTREPGRLALFAPGSWGDPRYVAAGAPSLVRVKGKGPLGLRRRPDGTVLVIVRLDLDSQAHLYAMLLGPGGSRPQVLKTGSRLGIWLHGGAAKTVQTLQRRPGAVPVRLRLSPKQLRPKTTYQLRVAAVDPYGRKTQILIPVRVG